jgi:hypothetical protein
MTTATPQDTFDHLLGAGAFGWHWWLDCKVTGETDATGKVRDDWTATLTCETGDGGKATKTIDHKAILAAARKVMADPPRFTGPGLARECAHLIFDPDACDFDAPLADELLQFMVLGEVVFG